MVLEITSRLAEGENGEAIKARAKGIRGPSDLCRDSDMCYYPEVIETAE